MIDLIPMSPEQYAAYVDQAVREYADEKVRAGNWSAEEALARSAEEHRQLLPEGPSTPNHYLFLIEDTENGRHVGMIWLARLSFGGKETCWVYDFRIDEPFRRRGYGEQALRAADEKARELGLDSISLHVFGHNVAARRLYEKMGYEITNINMTKRLG